MTRASKYNGVQFFMSRKKWLAFWFLAGTTLLNSCQRSQSLFETLPPSQTNIQFANNLDMSKSFRILYFFYYYNGAGVAAGDIDNNGLPDLFFTANSRGNNRLYLNKGNFQFEDITQKAGVAGNSDWCTGVTMADVNGDGFLDIYVSSVNNIYEFKGHNELYINNKGDGTFTESAGKYGLAVSSFANQASFFDYDHDGDLDCYILNQSFKPSENLVDTSYRRKFDANSGDKFYRNDLQESGRFTDVSATTGIYQSNLGYGLGISVADLNNDGWEDIYISNDFQENDYYYINNGNGSFTESGSNHFNHYSRFSMGSDIADFNNDGQLDIITADMLPPDEKTLKTYGSGEGMEIYKFIITDKGYQAQYSRNCLHKNNGHGKNFSDIGLMAGVSATDWSWAPLFADFDNDGNKDLFITSGIVKRTVDMDYIKYISALSIPPGTDAKEQYNTALEKIPDGASHNYIFKGDGQGYFRDKSKDWGFAKKTGYHNGAAYADLDNDGDLDLVVSAINSNAIIYKNNSPKKNFLSLRFNGDKANRMGIGVKAYLFSAGKLQYQQLMPTRGFQSSCETRLHFGLNMTTTADSLLVVWPDQKYQVLKNVLSNKELTLEYSTSTGLFDYAKFFPTQKPAIEEIFPVKKVWQHRENDFNDFQNQYLASHQRSIRGPRLAVADVNKDGFDDLFACGAKGQASCLMLQNESSIFISSDTALFADDAMSEDVDAVFADIDNDGDEDLYVASGGNEYEDGNPWLADRLYLNDGKGNFIKKVSGLATQLVNKACVSAGDIDNDKDIDFFVGTTSAAGRYGSPSSSYLLLNDGGGNFSIAPESMISLKNEGMITSSAIADIDKNGWNDLIIAGEWMSVTVFRNVNSKFTTEYFGDPGLWQSLKIVDVNSDGLLDIWAGNWGLNSKLATDQKASLSLYVKDFDNNGVQDLIRTYVKDGLEYPFLPKDELEQAIPVMKKNFLYYSDYAGKTINDIFDLEGGGMRKLKATNLSSMVLYNDGKGGFDKYPLPALVQSTPIFCFEFSKKMNSWIAGGNFFGVIPYEGAYDAASLQVFKTGGNENLQFASESQILDIKGQVRDMKWLRTKEGEILVVAKNNDQLHFYRATDLRVK
jgi:enediyne biosynthesis protein E4